MHFNWQPWFFVHVAWAGATELYLHSVSQLYLLLMFDIYLHKKWKSQLYLLSENAMLQLYLL